MPVLFSSAGAIAGVKLCSIVSRSLLSSFLLPDSSLRLCYPHSMPRLDGAGRTRATREKTPTVNRSQFSGSPVCRIAFSCEPTLTAVTSPSHLSPGGRGGTPCPCSLLVEKPGSRKSLPLSTLSLLLSIPSHSVSFLPLRDGVPLPSPVDRIQCSSP